MSGPRFDLKTVVQTNAYKERIQCEHKAAKAHQMQQCFGDPADIPGIPYKAVNMRRPQSTSGASQRSGRSMRSARSESSLGSGYTHEMDDRISRLERTIEEERSGRQNVMQQLDSLRRLIENQCVNGGTVPPELAKAARQGP